MPKIVFTTDEGLDIEIADSFIDQRMGDVDFGQERIINLHPQLSAWRNRPGSDRTMALTAYVKKFYEEHSHDFEDNLKKAAEIWGEVEAPFFTEMSKILGPLDFYPHDAMIGKLSVFACAVIEDDGRSFQVLYSLPTQDATEFTRGVAHEAVHFLTDAFMAKNNFSDLLEDWNFREVLPVMILNLPSVLVLTKRPECGYAQHQGAFLDGYRQLWSESKNFIEFLHTVRRAKNKGVIH